MSIADIEQILVEFPFAFWDSHLDLFKDPAISFVHWLEPDYGHVDIRHECLECVSFNAFPPPYRRPILLFYTFGTFSRHLMSVITGADAGTRFILLRDNLKPYYSQLPNYNPQTCVPRRILATEWSRDEFAGFGSYCNFKVGIHDAAEDIRAMRHGIPEHSIYFAGEHTSPFDGLGTVAGAYTSGERVAHRILETRARRA